MFSKKVNVSYKMVLNKLQFKELDNGRYLLSPEKNLKEYYNNYIWRYIQNDVIYTLVCDYKVYFMVYDEEYADIYSEYIHGYEIIRGNNNQEIKSFGVFSDNIDMYLITEFTEGTSIWDYTDLVCIFAVKERCDRSLMEKQFSDSEFFVLSIEPSGDNEGLYINFNPNTIPLPQIKNLISEVLSKYQVGLVCR